MLDDDGHICLTDFGLSKVFDDDEEKEAKTFCGTPEYLGYLPFSRIFSQYYCISKHLEMRLNWINYIPKLTYKITIYLPKTIKMQLNHHKTIKKAPEIIQRKNYTKAVDWWSLGILLFELTVGHPPFHSKSPEEMYRQILSASVTFPPFLSPECTDLLSKLLVKDPEKRLGSGDGDCTEIMAHQFFKNMNWELFII